MSEYIQSLLPYKTFEGGDILANLLGCTCGLTISWHLERYYRKRREIARLYTPLDISPDESLDEDELAELPTYRQSTGTSSFGRSSINLLPSIPFTGGNIDGVTAGGKGGGPRASGWPSRNKGMRRLGDAWDSGEELFTLGEEDEIEEDSEIKPGESPIPRR